MLQLKFNGHSFHCQSILDGFVVTIDQSWAVLAVVVLVMYQYQVTTDHCYHYVPVIFPVIIMEEGGSPLYPPWIHPNDNPSLNPFL